MPDTTSLLDFPQICMQIYKVGLAISDGEKGRDYLVLDQGEEMNGYASTPLEAQYKELVDQIENIDTDTWMSFMEAEGQAISSGSDLEPFMDGLNLLFRTLVLVKPAMDAYRARMWQYATDWGSEISPVGNASRRLYYTLKKLVEPLSTVTRDCLTAKLTEHYLDALFPVFYWPENDTHGSYYVKVSEVLGVTTTSERLAEEGHVYLEGGDSKKAKKCFKLALDLYRGNGSAELGLGILYYRQKKYNRAKNHLTNAKYSDGSDVISVRLLAKIAEIEQYEFLEYKYRDWIDRAPDDVEALFGMAMEFYRKGNNKGAHYYWDEVLKRDPDHEQAKKMVAKVPRPED